RGRAPPALVGDAHDADPALELRAPPLARALLVLFRDLARPERPLDDALRLAVRSRDVDPVPGLVGEREAAVRQRPPAKLRAERGRPAERDAHVGTRAGARHARLGRWHGREPDGLRV